MTRVRWDSTYGVPLGRVAHHAPRRTAQGPGPGPDTSRDRTGRGRGHLISLLPRRGRLRLTLPAARPPDAWPACQSALFSKLPGTPPGVLGLARAEQRPALPLPGVAACAGIGTTRLGGRMHARTHPRAPTYGCGWELEMARACRGVLADDASHAAMSMSKATYQPTVRSIISAADDDDTVLYACSTYSLHT